MTGSAPELTPAEPEPVDPTAPTRPVTIEVRQGESTAVLAALAPDSIDAVVTDPPYELAFMGKRWDSSGVAYDETMWAQVLRVLKPGGHLLAFGGTRTYHRMVCAIENVGFEVRDQVDWIYGQGFPKSQNVSKAIDKAAGATREVTGGYMHTGSRSSGIVGNDTGHVWHSETAPATDGAQQWDGWGTALKPAHEPIVVARKPLSERTVAANVLTWGTGAINVDGCRVQTGEATASGRWPANIVLTHSPECVQVGTRKVKTGTAFEPAAGRGMQRTIYGATKNLGRVEGYADGNGTETVEAWECVDGCPVAEMDAQSGNCRSSGNYNRGSVKQGVKDGAASIPINGNTGSTFTDSGGASRFFPIFRYQAKANNRERPQVGDIRHPTVKPLELMRWLVRLVTPPDGTVLDPFCGTGTTLEAAHLEGFSALGVDSDPDAILLTRERLRPHGVLPALETVVPVRDNQSSATAPTEGAPMAAQKDMFDDAVTSGAVDDDGVARDQYGRYLLPVPGAESSGQKGWTRATTFAKSISDTYTLSLWSQRMVAKGLTLDPGLYALASATPMENRDALNQIVERAKDTAGAKTRASLGTALHAFSEQVDRGESPLIPEPWDRDIAAYRRALTESKLAVLPHLIERIVLVQHFGVAGTFDRIARVTEDHEVPLNGEKVKLFEGEHVVVDLKTGRDLSYGWNEIAIQLALYARADGIWDKAAGTYEAMPDRLRTDVAVVIHLPVEEATATLYTVDIDAGWRACQMCADVRNWRKVRKLATPFSVIKADADVTAEPTPEPAPAPAAKPARKSRTRRAAALTPVPPVSAPTTDVDPGNVPPTAAAPVRDLMGELAASVTAARAQAAPSTADGQAIATGNGRPVPGAVPLTPVDEIETPGTTVSAPSWADRIKAATSNGELSAIRKEAMARSEWTASLLKLGLARKGELETA